jgi:hypothetical protein
VVRAGAWEGRPFLFGLWSFGCPGGHKGRTENGAQDKQAGIQPSEGDGVEGDKAERVDQGRVCHRFLGPSYMQVWGHLPHMLLKWRL